MFCPLFPMHIHNSIQPGKYSPVFRQELRLSCQEMRWHYVRKGSLSCDLRECIVSGLCNVQECFVFNSIAHDQCQISGCCVMFSIRILSIQAIRCDKIRILTSYLFCFPVEHSGKASTLPPQCSAMATAVSLWLFSIREYRRSSR